MDRHAVEGALDETGLFDADWYAERHPDVGLSGIDPRTHFLRYGLPLGRDPGPKFDGAFYKAMHEDAAGSDLPPLAHYLLHGRERYRTGEHAGKADEAARRKARMLGHKLFVLGFDETALAEIAAAAREDGNVYVRAYLAERMVWFGLWRDLDSVEGETLQDWLGRAELGVSSPARMDRLGLLRRLVLVRAGEGSGTPPAIRGRIPSEHRLVAPRETGPAARAGRLDRAMTDWGLGRVTLETGEDAPFDRLVLETAKSAGPATGPGPSDAALLTVVVAADGRDAAAPALVARTVAALRRSAPAGTGILLAVPGDDVLPEITGIPCNRVEVPAGATALEAAALGFAEASGRYATWVRAGDLPHPALLSTLLERLISDPGAMAVTARTLLLTPDLEARSWCGAEVGDGSTEPASGGVETIGLCREDPETALVRLAPVRDRVGARDTVPGAGANWLGRIETAFGPEAVLHAAPGEGPLLLRRDAGPAARDARLAGADMLAVRGARRDYAEAWRHAIDRTGPADISTLAAPVALTGKGRRHYDVILASDLRLVGGSTLSNAAELEAQKRAGLTTGLFQMYRYDFYARPLRSMLGEVRDEVDGEAVQVLTEEDEATCDLLVLRYPSILEHLQSTIPRIRAKTVRVIVNQPPMSDYTERAKVRYTLPRADANAITMFGTRPIWHPIGPLVREALHSHHAADLSAIDLSPNDWLNIIDLGGWEAPARTRGPGEVPRIGRHSRDHAVKWPSDPAEIRAAYPDGGGYETHVLGGATAPAEVLGGVPPGWTVHDFGSIHPRDFLKGIDFWVYFSHPDWVESFGRTIIEAMAMGVPVILPEIYRPLFGEHAIYATPFEVQDIVARLWADPAAYDAHVARALAHVRETYSFEMHVDRVRAAIAGRF